MSIYGYCRIKSNRQEINEIPQLLEYEYNTAIYKLLLDLKNGEIKKVALKSDSGQYVSALNGGGGLLLANSPEIGEYETFSLVPTGFDKNKIVIRTSNGYFLSATEGGGSSLRASRRYIGPEETFELIPLWPDKIAIKTANGYYIVAEKGGGNILRADRLAIGPWETFTLIPLEILQ